MNKILLIIFILILGNMNQSYSSEGCNNFIKFSWRYINEKNQHVTKDNAVEAMFNFKSTSSDEIKITRVVLLTSDRKVVREKQIDLYIKPYGINSEYLSVRLVNLDVVDKASYYCRFETEPSKSNNNSVKYTDNNKDNDYKQYWWVLIVLILISYFVYSQTSKNIAIKKKNKLTIPLEQKKNQNILIKFFKGELSLGLSYWGFLTAISTVFSLIIFMLQQDSSNEDLLGFIGLIYIPIIIYLYIGTWRSARNYKLEKIKKKEGYGWAIAAQVTMILGIVRMIMEIVKEFR